MIPRGEVGLIFASIGLTNGVLDADQYGGLILVVLVTTVITPPLLRWRLGRTSAARSTSRRRRRARRGLGGARDGEIALNATPPVALPCRSRSPRPHGLDGTARPTSCSTGSATIAPPS